MEVNEAGILNQPQVFLNTSMPKISKTKISAGVFWLEVPEAELFDFVDVQRTASNT